MPAIDPKSKSHHLRVTTDLSGVLTWLQDVSGSVIGLHPTSSKEKPHYHIWLESDRERTAQTIRNQMKQRNLEVFGNGSYSIRVHTEYDKWYNYVFCPCKGAVEVLYNTSHGRIEKPNCGKCSKANTLVYANEITYTGDVTGAQVVMKSPKAPNPKKEPAHIRFYNYFVENVNDGSEGFVEKEEIARHYIKWTKCNFAMRYGKPIIYYVYYTVNKYDTRIEDYVLGKLLASLDNF